MKQAIKLTFNQMGIKLMMFSGSNVVNNDERLVIFKKRLQQYYGKS